LPSSRPRQRFEDILDNIGAIQSYTAGLNLDAFSADARTRDAVERCLERISEAAAKLGDEAASLAPGQPWAEIRALGNRLRHEYDRVRADRLWQIVSDDLPSLRDACADALAKLKPGEGSA
jgi:uncharacterized protein with HEPN domain